MATAEFRLTPEQVAEIVSAVKASLLRDMKTRNLRLAPRIREVIPQYEEDEPFTCCGQDMVHKDFFHVRRYTCAYRPHHLAVYVNLSTGERVIDD